ncbi:RDD family protein [Oceanobacillus alkalisoli]|uniref:RDD family protein n=1 Tax=Oceanobacillus alkalisoli TaxID=2925113 RepID=UPI001EEFAD17|nr:RDD family protein [Oceanobacillus alkalisoli]MCF3942129.1 RDD family protein [Oceanobacillus alkalisoli]MCG5105006.1 RDD family protein [Oceanobacillus alkalisoli]
MEALTKKRLKASLIDAGISTVVSLGVEYFLRKKIKNEAFHTIVLPMLSQYTLEYVQLKNGGQTIGYRLMGIELKSEDGKGLTSDQILKRMLHRDTTSTIAYFKNRDSFEAQAGRLFPHDLKTGTIVREATE